MASRFVAWIVARPDDPSLSPLAALAPDVTLVVGGDESDFASAPAPDTILFATGTTAAFERVFARAPSVPWVHSRFAGVEHVLFPALVDNKTIVTNGRGAFAPSLAEFAIAALLYFAKDFRRMVERQREGRWDPFQPHLLAGRTLGIVGYGEIGRATAKLANALGMSVIAARRHPERSSGDPFVARVTSGDRDGLLELFAASDDVLLAVPLTPHTHKLVGASELAAMKPHGVLINVGRGPVIDEAALEAALARGKLRGAALDVFEVEPLPAGHPFYRNERVLLSPHCADRVPGWLERATGVFVENVRRRLAGEPLTNVVDKALGY